MFFKHLGKLGVVGIAHALGYLAQGHGPGAHQLAGLFHAEIHQVLGEAPSGLAFEAGGQMEGETWANAASSPRSTGFI